MRKTSKKKVPEGGGALRRMENVLKENFPRGRALLNQQQFYDDILDTIDEGIVHTTLKGRIISLNQSLERIIEIPKEKLIGKNVINVISEFLPGTEQNILIERLNKLISGVKIQPFQVKYNDRILEVNPGINRKTRRISGTIRDITDTVKINDALSKSEKLLRKAELTSKSGNWELHLETGRIYGSDGAARLYGVSKNEYDFEKIKNIPLPEYRPILDKALNDLITNNIPYNLEFRIKKADTGEIIDIHSICEYDSGKKIVYGTIQDITERKRIEQQLINKNNDLSKLFKISLQMLESINRNTAIQKIADQAANLVGTDTSAIYLLKGDKLFLEATSPELPPDFPQDFRVARIEDHPHIKKVIETGNTDTISDCSKAELSTEEKNIISARNLGSLVYIPLFIQKTPAGVIILGTINRTYNYIPNEIDLFTIYSNITSLALENSFLFDNLLITKEKAEESNRLKTAFLHNISHEIRTPLNAIVGFSDLLGKENITRETRKEYSKIILQSNNQLLSIIDDILNISQIEANQVPLSESNTDLELLLKNIYNQYRHVVSKKPIVFKLMNALETEDMDICTDEQKVLGIINNLVNNAIKFTNQGSIELGCLRKDQFIEFYVADTGIGIPEDEQNKIFDRFYQVNSCSSRLYGGMGLGLAISAAYAKILKSQIIVSSQPGKGSRFSFSIPYKKDYLRDKLNVSVSPQKQARAPGTRTILIAEDDDINYYFINEVIGKLGYKSLRAVNGYEAVSICTDKEIDLVLMDLRMPVMNGFDSAREILKNNPQIPVVIQTAYGHNKELDHPDIKNKIDVIIKPFSFEQLTALINKHVK